MVAGSSTYLYDEVMSLEGFVKGSAMTIGFQDYYVVAFKNPQQAVWEEYYAEGADFKAFK